MIMTQKEEEKKLEDCYKLGEVIGRSDNFYSDFCARGNFSIVREGFDLKSNAKLAIKTVTKTMLSDKEIELLSREIEVMKKLQHPNIVALQHVFTTSEQIHLVLE
jgi:serine/threonine protein kinase